jgi:S-adenosylmethionine:tRNA ribosyltransferase-isomerase
MPHPGRSSPTGKFRVSAVCWGRLSPVRVDLLDYHLPREQIAQRPLPEREASRLLLMSRSTGDCSDALFRELPGLLRGDELLVFNNARVIPARLFGRREGVHSQPPSRASAREHLTGTVEVFLVRQLERDLWEALVRPGRKLPVGERVLFGAGELRAEILSRGELGLRTVRFSSGDEFDVAEHIERLGHVPLPPYIERQDEGSDRDRYQTVFSKHRGAVAAPTAGLHFSEGVLAALEERGIESAELTLDVGLGTFQPIHAEELEAHAMHEESYEIPEGTAEAVVRARERGRPVVAVGTTVVRALEDSAGRALREGSGKLILPGPSAARIFLTPGHEFRAVDGLLTNFHLPRSTLLALVCAFAGREQVLAAYRHAVRSGYRFYSYGDCMLIR